MERVSGIDVSRWQGVVQWEQVAAAGHRYAIVRATIGDSYTDPRFFANWDGARDAGLLVSAYHVIAPKVSAEVQMAAFFNVLDDRPSRSPWWSTWNAMMVWSPPRSPSACATAYGRSRSVRHAGPSSTQRAEVLEPLHPVVEGVAGLRPLGCELHLRALAAPGLEYLALPWQYSQAERSRIRLKGNRSELVFEA